VGVLLTGAAQEAEDAASLQQISEAIEEGLESLTQDDTEKEDEARPAIHTQSEEEASKESYVRTETQVSTASEGSSSSNKAEISESRPLENRSAFLQNQSVSETEATEGGVEEEQSYSLSIGQFSEKVPAENFSPVAKGESAEVGTALSEEEFNAAAKTVCDEVVAAEPSGPLEQQVGIVDDHSNEDSRLLAVDESETQTLGAKGPDEVTKSQSKINKAVSLPICASAATVDKITENIWHDLLSDLATTVPPQLLRSGTVLKEQDEQERRQQQQHERQEPPKSERQIATAKIVKITPTAVSKSPTRSKPQDLMLTTFDISSSDSSGSSTDDKSPKVRLSTVPAATQSPDEDDNRTTEITAVASTGVIIDDDDDFYDDDDFGLSAIRHEAELLRLQELRVEAEIARIQREESEGKLEKIAASLRQIPDKPPPPYVPPPGQVTPPSPSSTPTTAAVIKPVRPPHPSRSFLPAGGEEIGGLASRLAAKLFRMKTELGSLEDLGDQLEAVVEEELAARPGDLRKVSSFLRCFPFNLKFIFKLVLLHF
jgi:hypothetical protein